MNNAWQHFKKYLQPTPQISQLQWLKDCLLRNQSCAYGQHYQFAKINTIEDYQKQLPIVSYEDLQPWLDQLQQKANILFSEPVVAFEKTGGSQSGCKLIPYSMSGLIDFRKALLPWLAELIDTYHIDSGVAYWALSPALQAGEMTEAGGDALYLGEDNLAQFLQLSAVPLSVAEILDLDDWQLVTLYYLIKQNDLRLISVWSPSFLIQLLNALVKHQSRLLTSFREGGVIAGHILATDLAAAKRLSGYLAQQNTHELWPKLAVISCWTDASSAGLAKELQLFFPQTPIQPKGLLSTEAVITTPNYLGQHLLCLQSNFYEFLDQQGDIYLANQLATNECYQVIVTTNSGLYRYKTGDQVLCLGYRQEYPILKFIGRSGVISDRVGEKLTESFVNQCLATIHHFVILTFNKQQQGYLLLIEDEFLYLADTLVAEIEQRLCNNPQYAYARKLNQLTQLTYRAIKKPSEQYINWQLKQGKRLGDIKIPSLLTQDWQQIFVE